MNNQISIGHAYRGSEISDAFVGRLYTGNKAGAYELGVLLLQNTHRAALSMICQTSIDNFVVSQEYELSYYSVSLRTAKWEQGRIYDDSHIYKYVESIPDLPAHLVSESEVQYAVKELRDQKLKEMQRMERHMMMTSYYVGIHNETSKK